MSPEPASRPQPARHPDLRRLPALARRAERAASVISQRVPVPPRADWLQRAPRSLGAHATFAVAMRELGQGQTPSDLQRTVRRMLAQGDRALAMHRRTAAVEWCDRALQLSFHPTVHHGEGLSPLAQDTASFLAPYRASRIGALLTAAPDEAAPEHPGGPRVLVVSHGSWTFVDRVVAGLRSEPNSSRELDIRVFDLSTLPPGQRPSHRGAVRGRGDLTLRGERGAVPPALAAQLDGVDTVFVEWGTYALAWLSQLDLPPVRLVARLHRFEAYTPYPMLTDFARVDEMLFVSSAVRGLVAATSPRLDQAHRVRMVDNPHDYTPFTTDKEAGCERTLIQVGWAIPVKDTLFTLDVLERLRQDDPSWRLLLVGPEPADPSPPREAAFVARLRSRLEAAAEGVEVLGRRDDVPAVMRRAGFVVSSSRHEGTHESVAEGAMAGCVPVVRDWPEAVPFGGAASVYPSGWVVSDVEQAAQRILASADPEVCRFRGLQARQWVLDHRNPRGVLEPYREALLGG